MNSTCQVGRFSPFLQATQALRWSRGIALLFSRTFGTRSGWKGQSHVPAASTPGKDPVPIAQEAGCAPGLVCTGGESCPHRDSIQHRPARSQSLSQLRYPVQVLAQSGHEFQSRSAHVARCLVRDKIVSVSHQKSAQSETKLQVSFEVSGENNTLHCHPSTWPSSCQWFRHSLFPKFDTFHRQTAGHLSVLNR